MPPAKKQKSRASSGKKRPQVAVVGAGPAGLVLACMLLRGGIQTVILERSTREHVESNMRAALVEHRTAAFFDKQGLASDALAHAPRTGSCTFIHDGAPFSVPYGELTRGRLHHVCPQNVIVRELIGTFLDLGGSILFSTEVTDVEAGTASAPATVHALRTDDGEKIEIACDFVALADGSRGPSASFAQRKAAPPAVYHQDFRWLAVLADVPPISMEIVYGAHEDGSAAQMPRTPQVSRFYMQCGTNDGIDDWPDERIFEALGRRLQVAGRELVPGPVTEKAILGTDSFVHSQMRHGRVFLLGDAAHLIVPAGGKGMNLAIGDAEELAESLQSYFRKKDEEQLSGFSDRRLPKVWKAQNFAQWFIELTHRPAPGNPNPEFVEKLRVSRLEQLREGSGVTQMFAEAYAGDPT